MENQSSIDRDANFFIQEFNIYGLFGYKNIGLKFKNHVQILIGENGFGKTTILNALFYLLKGDYDKLRNINFFKIRLVCDNRIFEFEKQALNEYCSILKRKKMHNSDIESFILEAFEEEQLADFKKIILDGEKSKEKWSAIITQNPKLSTIPEKLIYSTLLNRINEDEKFKHFSDLKTIIELHEYTLLYFPTYRRIEEELENLVGSLPRDSRRDHYFEELFPRNRNFNLIQFGMQDVRKQIDKVLTEIRQISLNGYAVLAGQMLNEFLKDSSENKKTIEFNPEDIRIVLSRMSDELSEQTRDLILEQIESKDAYIENPYALTFIRKLLHIYEQQKKFDTAIKDFVKTCNKYLSSKSLIYNESALTLDVFKEGEKGEIIKLENLSSGEKQLISIMARIYLSINKKFIILFDEPELSMSVFWQEKFLPDIINSNKCAFMMAVTHSPFIFDNELREYAVGLKEFLIHE